MKTISLVFLMLVVGLTARASTMPILAYTCSSIVSRQTALISVDAEGVFSLHVPHREALALTQRSGDRFGGEFTAEKTTFQRHDGHPHAGLSFEGEAYRCYVLPH